MPLTLLSKGASWIPMSWVRPLSGVSLVVPFYHVVGDHYLPHVSNLYRFRNVQEFRQDLEFFTRNFKPVSLSDIVDALDGRGTLPPSCFHLTFDDGFREAYDIIAPILRRAGIPATFFIPTSFLDNGGMPLHNELSLLLDRLESSNPPSRAERARFESLLPPARRPFSSLRERVLSIRYAQRSVVAALAEALDVDLRQYVLDYQPHLSSDELADLLRQGFSVGSHSCDHPLYSDLPLDEQFAQTRVSMELLISRFGISPKAFAFPFNDSGVRPELFSKFFAEPLLNVSFGTSGLIRHFNPRNIQRISMEKTAAPAEHIVARQFARATFFRVRSGSARQRSGGGAPAAALHSRAQPNNAALRRNGDTA